MNIQSKIAVLGGTGLVGSAIIRELKAQDYTNIVAPSSKQLNLTHQTEVYSWFADEKPDFCFMAAGLVGGIKANSDYPAQFIYDNLIMNINVIDAALTQNCKLLVLGSSCIYPKHAQQPMTEEALLTGYLEPTNEPYAIAKIAALKMVEAYRQQYGAEFISLMPTNLYGENDNYNLETCHVLPALIKKIHEAKKNKKATVHIWGTGKPKREFLYSGDLAKAAIFAMNNYNESGHINVGTGEDISIAELVWLIADVIGYEGAATFDSSKPDGTPRKLLDVSKINKLGWRATTPLRKGIELTYQDFLKNEQ